MDPLARREFWHDQRAGRAGVTILVTTHFMEEAEYCDRLAIMARARFSPWAHRRRSSTDAQRPRFPTPTLEDAFISLIEDARKRRMNAWEPAHAPARQLGMRLRGLVRKEFLQMLRDPSSIAIAFLLPVVLLLLFGYGVSLDAKDVPLAWWSNSRRADSASFAGALRAVALFRAASVSPCSEAEQACTQGEVDGIVWSAQRLRRAACGQPEARRSR